MKKILMVVGGVVITVVVILVVVAAIFIPRTLKLDKEATSYVQDAVPKIVARWNAQELLDRESPQLMTSVKSREKVDQLFVMFSRLGGLKHLNQPTGGIFSSAFTGEGAKTVGNYRAVAEFQNGTAEVQIQLLRVGEGWKINGFHINSDALLPSMVSPTPDLKAQPTT